LSRPFRLNCVISFIFYLYLMLHACVQRFDVMRNLKILAKFLASKRCLMLCQWYSMSRTAQLRFLRRQSPDAPREASHASSRHQRAPESGRISIARRPNPTTAARRSRSLSRGPHGNCGDRPIGPSGCSMGQGGTAITRLARLCGRARITHVTPVRSPRCRALLPSVRPFPACSRICCST
jgi:hypothetical protein